MAYIPGNKLQHNQVAAYILLKFVGLASTYWLLSCLVLEVLYYQEPWHNIIDCRLLTVLALLYNMVIMMSYLLEPTANFLFHHIVLEYAYGVNIAVVMEMCDSTSLGFQALILALIYLHILVGSSILR